MSALPQNVQLIPPWRALTSILHVFGISSTMFRLWQRHASRKLWCDDFVALFAAVADCILFAALQFWTRSEPNGTTFGKGTTITFYWAGVVCSLLVSWSARISLALAIARIFPPGRTIRRFALGMAWSFSLVGVAILLAITVSCAHDTSWHNSPEVQCDIPKTLGIAGFSANVTSDTLLVLTPLRMLWRVKLPDEQRRLILACFTASVWTGIAGGVCFIFMFEPNNWGLSQKTIFFFLAHVTASVSLMVCNLMVVVAYVYRMVRSDKDLEHSISEAVSSKTSPLTPNMSPLTTIILTDPGSLEDGFSQNLYRRGFSHNSHSFPEGNLPSFSPSSLSIKSQTAPQMGGSMQSSTRAPQS